MIRLTLLFSLVLTTTLVAGEVSITEEQRQAVIEHAEWLMGGRRAAPSSLGIDEHELHDRPVCGTPVTADYMTIRRSLAAGLGASALGPRPSLPDSYASPSGRFRIHYATTDSNAVYQPNTITNPAGVPDYVYNMALIADSLYTRMVTNMGYPPPLADDGYPEGGDSRYDIYIRNLPNGILGQTWPDSIDYNGDSTKATSFIEMDNNYSQLSQYRDNPLVIVRVTLAHEFFHAIQFAIDWREADFIPLGQQVLFARPWMEMSAVWMEEQMYDGINDYYGYLPDFFNTPRNSIEQFNSFVDIHPYASVTWPIFLTEYFNDPDVIREIWRRCGELGFGYDFLQATQLVIDSISGGTENWASAFREFALWNYFTGSRASFGPNDVGYSERANYPEIPESQIGKHGFDSLTYQYPYPAATQLSSNPFRAEHNATSYVRFEQTRRFTNRYWLYTDGCGTGVDSLTDDCIGYVVWDTCADTLVPGMPIMQPCFVSAVADTCNDSLFASACIDSAFTTDSTQSWDRIDSSWNIFMAYRTNGNGLPWGMNLAYRYDDIPDSFTVDRILLPVFGNANAASLSSDNPARFRSILMTLSQASDFRLYSPGALAEYAYRVRESASPLDPSQLNLPGAVLYPYPNPAVLSEMTEPMVTFLFQMPTDASGSPILVRDSLGPNNVTIRNPELVIDIFTIAGERVVTVVGVPELVDELGEYRIQWDMKNQSGREVASGAYIAYARMFDTFRRGELVAEAKVKVAIIR